MSEITEREMGKITEMAEEEFPLSPDTQEIWNVFSYRLRQFIQRRVENKHDAEDILQNVFYKIHNGIHHLKDTDKLQAWLYQITRNAIIDHYRRKDAVMESEELPEEEPAGSSTHPNANAEIIPCLEPMIERLPEKYREAIVLTDIERLTQKEMAEKLGLSQSGAKSRVQRSRQKLKEMLLECCRFELDRSGNIIEYQLKEQNSPCCNQDRVTFKRGQSQSQINDRRKLLKSVEVTYQPEPLSPAPAFQRGAACTKKPTEE